MKVKALLAISADGFIAQQDDQVSWSEDHWKNYFKICNEVKNLIVGRRTYDLMIEEGEFNSLSLDNCIVVSRSETVSDASYVIHVSSPDEAVKILREKSVQEAILGGGTTVLRSFLEEDLIDELLLDVEPFIYGNGYGLFGEISATRQLQLTDTFKSGDNTVRLHYHINGKLAG